MIPKLVIATNFVCSRLVGNIWMRSRAILVYHHFTLNSSTTPSIVMMQPGPWHTLLIRPLMVNCVCEISYKLLSNC